MQLRQVQRAAACKATGQLPQRPDFGKQAHESSPPHPAPPRPTPPRPTTTPHSNPPPTWKLMLSGGLPQGFLSRVVAISSTPALSVCSASPA